MAKPGFGTENSMWRRSQIRLTVRALWSVRDPTVNFPWVRSPALVNARTRPAPSTRVLGASPGRATEISFTVQGLILQICLHSTSFDRGTRLPPATTRPDVTFGDHVDASRMKITTYRT
jgi:hypothetical protein